MPLYLGGAVELRTHQHGERKGEATETVEPGEAVEERLRSTQTSGDTM